MTEVSAVIDDVLAHHGIKGQKWGVRRSKKELDKLPASPDAVKVAEFKKVARKQGVSALSNDQLKELNNRLKLEASYNQWAAANPTLRTKAVKFVASELIKEGTKQLTGQGDGSQIKSLFDQFEEQYKTSKAESKKKMQDPATKKTKKKAKSQQNQRSSPASKGGPLAKPGQVHNITTLR